MYHVFSVLVTPATLILMGSALLWAHARFRGTELARVRRWWLLSILLVYLYMSPLVAYFALATLEWQEADVILADSNSQAIVIVSGGAVRHKDLDSGAMLASNSIRRSMSGADLAAQLPDLPVVLSGGKVHADTPGPQLATMMQRFCERLGIEPERILVEDRSTTTFENAALTRAMLHERDIDRIIVVTDAIHMPRAAGAFRQQGFTVDTWSSGRGARSLTWSFSLLAPSPHAAADNQAVCHEWLGILWYKIRGRVA